MKVYQQPKIRIVALRLEKMVAASFTVPGDPQNDVVAGGRGARLYDDEWDDE